MGPIDPAQSKLGEKKKRSNSIRQEFSSHPLWFIVVGCGKWTQCHKKGGFCPSLLLASCCWLTLALTELLVVVERGTSWVTSQSCKWMTNPSSFFSKTFCLLQIRLDLWIISAPLQRRCWLPQLTRLTPNTIETNNVRHMWQKHAHGRRWDSRNNIIMVDTFYQMMEKLFTTPFTLN